MYINLWLAIQFDTSLRIAVDRFRFYSNVYKEITINVFMPGIKIVIGVKNGRCVQRELTEDQSKNLYGKKIGDTLQGDIIGLAGYEFLITGGSDYCGFPMRKDVTGLNRRKILAVEGVGLRKKAAGIRVRKTVAGNTIHQKIHQINLKVVKEGQEKLVVEELTKTSEVSAASSEQTAA